MATIQERIQGLISNLGGAAAQTNARLNQERERLDQSGLTSQALTRLQAAQSNRVNSPEAGLKLLSGFAASSPGAAFGSGILANKVDFANFVNQRIDDARENLKFSFEQRSADRAEAAARINLENTILQNDLLADTAQLQVLNAQQQNQNQLSQIDRRTAGQIQVAAINRDAQIAREAASPQRRVAELKLSEVENAQVQAQNREIASNINVIAPALLDTIDQTLDSGGFFGQGAIADPITQEALGIVASLSNRLNSVASVAGTLSAQDQSVVANELDIVAQALEEQRADLIKILPRTDDPDAQPADIDNIATRIELIDNVLANLRASVVQSYEGNTTGLINFQGLAPNLLPITGQ